MHKNIRLLSLFNFFTDFHFYSALLIIYFANVTGSYTLGMSLFSVAMVSSAIFEVPTGIYSDYIGRKKTMMLGAICATLAIVFYATGMNYWILFVGALFEGLQRAFYSGNNDALLYESLSDANVKKEYDHYLGRTSAMFQVASAMGIIIGGIMAIWSLQIVMWLSVIPQIICLLISLQVTEPINRSRKSTNIYSHLLHSAHVIWTNKKLRLLSVSSIINFAIGESTYQFRSAFVATLWPIWAIGFSKVLSSLGAAISYWYSGKLIKKFGALKILFISDIYGKVNNILSVAIGTVFSPALLSTTSLFYGVKSVANSKLMQEEFDDKSRATLGSIGSLFGNIAFGIFAILIGTFADTYGPTRALIFAYVCSLPTLFINWSLFSNHQNI